MLNRYCMLNHGIWWHPTVIVKLMASCWPFHSTLDHPLSWMLSDLSDLSAKPSWEMTSSASWLLFTGDMWFDPTIGHNMWMDMDGHNMIKPKWPNLYVCKVYVYMNYYIYIVAIRVLWYGSSTPTCIHIYMYIYMYMVFCSLEPIRNRWLETWILIPTWYLEKHHHVVPAVRIISPWMRYRQTARVDRCSIVVSPIFPLPFGQRFLATDWEVYPLVI